MITLVYGQPNFFKLDHLELVQAIADQAGVAVLNARLYSESQRQARVMTDLANSATAITASLKRDDVLEKILEQTTQALQVEAVSLALIDQKKNELVFEASTSIGDYDISGLRLSLDQGIAGWVARGKGVVVPDVHQDPRFFSGIDQTTGFTTSAIACAPVSFSGEVIGVLEAINPKKGTFDADALTVLKGSAVWQAQPSDIPNIYLISVQPTNGIATSLKTISIVCSLPIGTAKFWKPIVRRLISQGMTRKLCKTCKLANFTI